MERCDSVFIGAFLYTAKMTITAEQIAEEALSLPSEAHALLADRLVEILYPAEDGLCANCG